ncbi:MAG: hypothetical protein H7A55_23260 [Verrucomicrobiaceae bacterium]|nr:hypothetical protein [Verrucomicrobiaceae bacterium]
MHSLKDALLIRTLALPAAGAAANTDRIDLGQAPPNEFRFEVELDLPALPSLADTKKATIVLEDSADGTTFAAIPGLAALEVAGAGGTGAEAINRRLRLPADVRQYLRANVTVEAAAGDNTAQSLTMALVF